MDEFRIEGDIRDLKREIDGVRSSADYELRRAIRDLEGDISRLRSSIAELREMMDERK